MSCWGGDGENLFLKYQRLEAKMFKGYEGADNSALPPTFVKIKAMGSNLMLILAQELEESVFVTIP